MIEGTLITLVCESSGIPPPSLTWIKDGELMFVRDEETKETWYTDKV